MIKHNNTIHNKRVGLLDDIRGLCIIGVVIFHGMYDITSVLNITMDSEIISTIMLIVQPLGSGAFVFISGIVSKYSKNNIKRGAVAFGLGSLISLITIIASNLTGYNLEVKFGILSLLGSSMFLYGVAEKVSDRLRSLTSAESVTMVAMIITFALFLIFYTLPEGYVSIFGLKFANISENLYNSKYLYPLGFPNSTFYSTDYFPIIPWTLLFASGTFAGVYFKENKMPEFFYKSYFPLLNFAGRHSMVIYLIHQPILFLFFGLLSFVVQS